MLSVLFPSSCLLCGRVLGAGERHVCARCMARLPLIGGSQTAMQERFAWLPEVELAAAWMHYRPRSESARLLEAIKYGGYSRLATTLGECMAHDFAPRGLLTDIDAIVPVPLHWLRRLRRGYNQSERLAQGVSIAAGIPVVNLMRAKLHRSQTRLDAQERKINVRGAFRMRDGRLTPTAGHPLRLLLMDDVCTTGATLGALAEAILAERPDTRLRILTLAATSH